MRPSFSLMAALCAAAFTAILVSGCAGTPEPGVSSGGVLSYDGLTPLEDTMMDRVWVREGYTLSGYRKVILQSAGIRYRPVVEVDSKGRQNAAVEFPVSAAQKADLERLITEEFDQALDRLKLAEVGQPGPDVLLVRGYMLDVVSEAPSNEGSTSQVLIDSVGQATFVVELVDSQTSTVLVRAVDTRSARTPGRSSKPGTASNNAQLRQIIARWAELLVDALNDLTAIEELQGA